MKDKSILRSDAWVPMMYTHHPRILIASENAEINAQTIVRRYPTDGNEDKAWQKDTKNEQ